MALTSDERSWAENQLKHLLVEEGSKFSDYHRFADVLDATERASYWKIRPENKELIHYIEVIFNHPVSGKAIMIGYHYY